MDNQQMNPQKISKKTLKYWEKYISKDYLDLANSLYYKTLDQEISNSNLDHAMFLSFLLIKRAKNKIRIFTNNINEVFFKNFIIRNEFEKAIQRGVKIHILISEGNLENFSDFDGKERLFIHKLKTESPIKNHFLLSDEFAFRIEAPHTEEDLAEKRIKGFANFNDPYLTQKISKVYDEFLLKNSRIIN